MSWSASRQRLGVEDGGKMVEGEEGGSVPGNGDGILGLLRTTAGWSLFWKLSLTWEYRWRDRERERVIVAFHQSDILDVEED